MAAVLSYERCCAEIVAQTDLLRSHIKGADLTTPVPSCPGWNVGQLVRHLGGGQRWAAKTVRTRATRPLPDHEFRDLAPYANEDAVVLDPWLVESATRLAGALSAAGPDTAVWTPLPDGLATTTFWARRYTYETLMHRADAALAVGAEFAVEADVALDAIDEWMELGSLPLHFDMHPRMKELLGPGRTLHLHATDTPADAGAEWVVDLTGDVITWRRAHERSAVAVRAPLTDLLLIIYRRRPPRGDGIEVFGDAKLLDFWLSRVGFGSSD